MKQTFSSAASSLPCLAVTECLEKERKMCCAVNIRRARGGEPPFKTTPQQPPQTTLRPPPAPRGTFYNCRTANLYADSLPPLCTRSGGSSSTISSGCSFLPSFPSSPLGAPFFKKKRLKGGRGADESEKNKYGGLKIGPHQNGKLMKDFSPSPRPPKSPFKENIRRKQKSRKGEEGERRRWWFVEEGGGWLC